MNQQESNKPELLRVLGLGSAFSIIVGSVIGSGVFLVVSDISKSVAAPGLALSIWIVAGIFSLIGGLVFAELGAMFPGAGGQYVYFRKAFGPLAAFLFNWTHSLILIPGTIAAVAVGFAQFFSSGFHPLTVVQMKVAASLAVALFTIVNLFGVKRGADVLDALTWVKILALIAVAVAGLAAPLVIPEANWHHMTSDLRTFKFSSYGVGLIAAFWAFDGWNGLSQVAGEIKNPQRNIPLASFTAIATVIILYFAVNLVYFRLLSHETLVASQFAGADAASVLWGNLGVKILAVLIIISALGCVSGTVLSGARVPYMAARDGSFPQVLAHIHPKYRVPSNALMFQGLWSIILVWSGRYDQLFTYVICADFIFYGLTSVALIKLRQREPNLERPYRLPFYPWLPLAYLIFTILFIINTFVEKPTEAFIGFTIVALGIPGYWWFKKKDSLLIQQTQ